MKPTSILIPFTSLLLLLTGCTQQTAPVAQTSQNSSYGDETQTQPAPVVIPPPTTPSMAQFDQLADPVTGDMIATIQTSKGTIKVKFFPQFAPETVKNFIELSKKSFYDGLIFHRVIDGFMIQGGDPEGTGMGGESYKGPGTTLKAEIVPELKHIKGALAMARKGYDINSASSQFYIVQNQGGVMQLNGQYTIFGQVTDGLTVVDAIAKVKVNDEDRPLSPVTIKKITVEEVK